MSEIASTSRIRVLAAAALFSTGGAVIKACDLTGWQVAGFRSGTAAVAIFLLLPGSRRWLRSPRTWLVGFAYAGTLVFYATANKLTTAANTIFLQSTAPLYVLLLAPVLLKERVRRRDVPFMAAMAMGMALFFVDPPVASGIATDPVRGNVLGTLAGVSWGLTILGLRWLESGSVPRPGMGAAGATAGNVIAFLVTLPFALPVGASDAGDWLWIVYLGVIQVGVAYVLLTSGIRGVPAVEASLLLLLEPVLTPIWAWLGHGERPGPWAIAGGAVILGASAVRTLRRRRGPE